MNPILLSKLLVAILFSSNILASSFPVTIANCQHIFTIYHAPKRMIINDLNMAEMAFTLQLQPQIIGLTGISGWYKQTLSFQSLRGNIPELTPKYPVLENLLIVHPDFFFAGWNYGMKVGGEVTPDTLKPFGIRTLVLSESCIHVDKQRPRASMDLLYDDMIRLGKVFGKAELAQQIVRQWQEELAVVKIHVDHQPLRVFVYDSGEDKPFTSGKYGMPTAIIEAAGGRNIFDKIGISWGTVAWETVAVAQPDFIILLDYQANGGAVKLQTFLESHPLMRLIPAVRHHRYLVLRYEELTPGPANIGAVKKLARALYFSDKFS